MLLERVILCAGMVLLAGATSALADEPTPLTSRELDGITVLRFVPDPLDRLRITVDRETDDSDSVTDEIVTEELEERRLRLAAQTRDTAPAGTPDAAPAATATAAATAATAASGGGPGSWTSPSRSYGSSARASSATERVGPARSASSANEASRSSTTVWSSRPTVAAAAHRRSPDERAPAAVSAPASRHWAAAAEMRAPAAVVSTPASRHRAAVAEMRAGAGQIMRRFRQQAVSARP